MTLTIVMYHYVRDLARSRYPEIKGLTIELFERQLAYIAEHHTVVGGADVIAAVRGESALPDNALWLTFDDGFREHLEVVCPRLVARGMVGSFYPPVVSARHETVLDVHKLHFLLASAPIATIVDALVAELRARDLDADALRAEHAVASRWDGPEVMFVKRVLQRGLPPATRGAITERLFARFVAEDTTAFSRELYLGTDELRALVAQGMEVGGHGARHDHLTAMTPEEQDTDIEAAMAFVDEIYGGRASPRVLCYPYGSYDATTVEIARRRGVALALTTKVGVVEDLSTPLELKRIDANDLTARL